MKIVMVEGNQQSTLRRAAELGVRSSSQVYIDAIRRFYPDLVIDVIYGADDGHLPAGKRFQDYQGMVMGGSGLHAYDKTPEVTHQIDLMREFSETGRPILGSCWGLQIAAIAAGGEVGPSDIGRELGIARKIVLSEAGRAHPFFKDKPAVFDAPCIHYDEITRMPEGATLLCSNSHSQVQGAIIPIGKSELWGVQYHPEFDLSQLRMLYELYRQDMIDQGFVADYKDHQELIAAIARLKQILTTRA